MLRATGILFSLLATAVSLAMLVAAGWLWYRSMHMVDIVARVQPAPNNQSALRGVGSYKGAMLFGSLFDSNPVTESSGYQHQIFPVLKPASESGGSLLQVVPNSKKGALGFGHSTGELRLSMPFLFMFAPPARNYEVVYVPYYFVMLLGVMQPARVVVRSMRRSPSSQRPLISTAVSA